jgi:hypothetical protein
MEPDLNSRGSPMSGVAEGTATKTFDVFVSHSTDDRMVANAVTHALEARGLRCWIAPRDITPGRDWDEAIVDAIDECRVMVLVLSASSNASGQVIKEVQNAVDGGATVIPFRIADVPLAKALRFRIGSAHWLDAVDPPMEARLDELGTAVETLLGRGARPSAAAAGADAARPHAPAPASGSASVWPPVADATVPDRGTHDRPRIPSEVHPPLPPAKPPFLLFGGVLAGALALFLIGFLVLRGADSTMAGEPVAEGAPAVAAPVPPVDTEALQQEVRADLAEAEAVVNDGDYMLADSILGAALVRLGEATAGRPEPVPGLTTLERELTESRSRVRTGCAAERTLSSELGTTPPRCPEGATP